MPQTVSVVERIALDIVLSLKDITTANGYQNSVADVLRPNPGIGNDVTDRRLIVVQEDPEKDADAPEQYNQWRQHFSILCMVQESETSTTAIDTRLNSLAADVESCLCKSRSTSGSPGHGGQTRGGLAEDTILEARASVPADVSAHDGIVVVNVTVLYRTKYNDPMTSIYDT